MSQYYMHSVIMLKERIYLHLYYTIVFNGFKYFVVTYSKCFSLQKYLKQVIQVTCFGILKTLVCAISNTVLHCKWKGT